MTTCLLYCQLVVGEHAMLMRVFAINLENHRVLQKNLTHRSQLIFALLNLVFDCTKV